MDSECVSVLPQVCKVLAASESSLPDDTSLEKLLDWFTALTKAGVSLLKDCPCLLEFVSTVFYNAAADPSILSFALKLTGLMASTDASFTVLQERSMLDLVFDPQHWQEAGLWEDPCIRVGWIQGLRTMLEHGKALRFFVQADFIEPLLQLQTDTSLFVTAAASQMLAHILLFSQSVPSVRCNGADKKDKDDRVPRALITHLEQSTVTTESTQDSGAVAMVISEYLKKFLVPKGASQYHQSQQILKLLALVLAQARPPLREKLLLTVADSLEELVTKNCSQLTLPLMDVILVARRGCGSDVHVPDQRADRLLSLMLNTGKPADLIHAAAALLRSGHDGCVQRVQSARLLLLPLDIITGLTLLDTNSAAGEQRFSMVEQLKSKTSCISIICVSVTSTPRIILLGPDCLPCPPVLIVSAVLSILRMCIGDSLKTGCVHAFRNVTNSGKVQKCALEALSALSCGPEVKVALVEVLTLLIQYLDHPDSDPTVLQKSYQAFLKWISVCTDLLSETEQLREDLMRVVRKRVCDMRWEVRDSTVEFLGHLAGVRASQMSADEACDASEILLGGCCFTTPLLKEGLQDPESYVRASSISALAQTLAHSWHQGAELTHEQTELVNRLLEILTQDTEGFARRAVVLYFITWFSSYSSSDSCSLLMPSVRSVLSQGSADLDWEVKVHTLDLAELLMDQAFSGHRGYTKGLESHPIQPHPYAVMDIQAYTLHTHTATHMQDIEPGLVGALRSLVEQGVLSALLSGLVDCDRPVGLKACRLLIRLRDTICPLLSRVQEATGTLASDTRVSCELPRRGWAQEIINILGMKKKSKEADTLYQRSFHEADVFDSQDCDEAAEEDAGAGWRTVRVSVCEVLSSLALDERLDILTQSSDHIHNSPLSLLQDLLTASATHAHSNSQPDQEVIVDCY